MPLSINERAPLKFPVTKPRTSVQSSSSATGPDKKQFLNKLKTKQMRDKGGQKSWKPPSSEHHNHTQMDDTMGKSYADNFFNIKRGHNKGSVGPQYKHNQQIDRNKFFPTMNIVQSY